MDQSSLHVMNLHIGIDFTPSIGIPVLAIGWQLSIWIMEWENGVDNVFRVIGNETGP